MKRLSTLAILRQVGAWLAALMFGLLCLHGMAIGVESAPSHKSIIVAMDDNYPPYIFRDQKGTLQGILIDTWKLWSLKTGIQANIVATDWDNAQALMRKGKVDVLDTLFETEERLRALDFSKPYTKIDVRLFFHKSISGIKDVKSLEGITVGVKAGDASVSWLTERGAKSLKQYSSYEAIIQAAKKNEILVFCMDEPPAIYLIYKNNMEEEFRYTEALYFGEFHWATRKTDTTLNKLVEQGFDLISAAERKQIDDRWKGASLGADRRLQYVKYLLYVLLLVLVISVALAWFNRTLRRKVTSKTSELSATLDALRASERYNRMLFENTALGLGLRKLDGTIIDANQAFADIVGYSIEEVLRINSKDLTAPEYHENERVQEAILLENGHFGPFEKEYIHRSGERIPVRLIGTLVERDGERCVLASVEDISMQKSAQERINFLAFHDALTGLPNRLLAQDRFAQAIAQADRVDGKVAMLFLDLDNFKTINDSLGHAAGDTLLKSIAARLNETLRETDTISRQGGDEFLILLPALPDVDAVGASIAKVMARLLEVFEIEGHELSTSASVGVAIYPDDGEDFDTLLKNADIAMYQAKDSGRNAYRFFDEKMHADAMERMRLGSGLRRALERGELQLYYQPLINLANNAVIGAEALLRWNHPEQGMIPPVRFIPIAEDSGMIVPIGAWVLREACRQAVEWQRAGWHGLQMAVNLSAVQFQRDDLEHTVIAALESSGIDPMLLELELTESILISDTENVLATVRRLKSLGVRLSIDDFGTGYSSLSYLKRFAVDKLKIDRSFIRDLTSDPDDAAIVRAIIQMARNLGLRTIAEGVEDAKTLEWLRVFQCNEAQGYYFAAPMPAAEFSVFVAAHNSTAGKLGEQ